MELDLKFNDPIFTLIMNQNLDYQLAKPKSEEFIPVPGMNIALAKTKARAPDGKILRNISWYDAKLLIQDLGSNYFMPTSAEWSKAERYYYLTYPEVEMDFTARPEWVDSLLAFPNEKGEYNPRLKIPDIKKGRVPLLIERSKVVKTSEKRCVIEEGRVMEVPELPLRSGYIKAWDDDLGLPTKVGENPSEEFEKAYFWLDASYGGLRAIVRGLCTQDAPGRRFSVTATFSPSESSWKIGFRLAKRVSDEDFVKIPRANYEELSELSEELKRLSSKYKELSSLSKRLNGFLSRTRV